MALDMTVRKNGIGASEAAAVLGLSAWRTPLDVYIDKTKEHHGEWQDTPATKRGRRLEPIVLDMYEEECGLVLRDQPTIFSGQYPFMFATLDAKRVDDERPVEAKTASKYMARKWGESGTDFLPQEYLVQLMHQMIVAEKTIGDLAALITLDDFRTYTIERDDELAEMITEGLKNFWKRVINRDPPPPTTGEEADRFYRQSIPDGIEATPEIQANFHELLATRGMIKTLERKEEKLLGDIKLFLAEKDTLLISTVPVATWKTSKGTTRLDAKRLQLEMPDIHAKYQTQSEGSRRFIIKGENKND